MQIGLAAAMCSVTSFTTYNRMLLPTGFGDPKAEYDRLLNGVSLWDVGAERQIEIVGPDAARLAQAISPRDLSKQQVGQGKYVATLFGCQSGRYQATTPDSGFDDHRPQ